MLSGTPLDNINSSSKRLPLDGGDFVAALNKNTQNPIKENPQPQQTIKNEQPTPQSKPAIHNTSKNESTDKRIDDAEYTNEAIDSDNQLSEEPVFTDNTSESELMSSATLITNVPLSEISSAEFTHNNLEVAVDTINVIELIDNTIISMDEVETEIDSSLSGVKSKQTSDIESAKIEIASFYDEGMEIEKDIALPEAIISSEVRQLQPIETPRAQSSTQESSIIDENVTDQNTKAPEMHVSSDTTKSPTNNLDESSANDVQKQPMNAEVAPENMQQVAANSIEAQANNARSNKVEFTREQARELSIVESVKVETASSSENSNPEMSMGFGNEDNNPLKTTKTGEVLQDFKPIDHADTSSTAKLLNNTSINAEMIIEQPEDMQSISNQIKTAAHTLSTSTVNAKSISIALTPEALGRIEIELHMKDGHINTIEIKATRPETLQILEKNAHILQDALNKLEKVSDGNNANLSFSLNKGNDGNNPKQEAQKPSQEFSFLNLKPESDNSKATLRTLSDYSSK